jgi:Tfp pilus assembly protein PilW
MSGTIAKRLVREESGFTLPEILVTIVMMIVVLFALYSIFDMSVRVFSFGNDKVEAVENARLGLEKTVRELRQAYAFDKANGNPLILETWTETQIRFGNDLDGNAKIECPNTDAPPQCEKIGYQVYEFPAGSGNFVLGRDTSSTSTTNTFANLQPVVEYVDYVSPTNTGLSFEYFERDGTTPVEPGMDPEADIGVIRIELRIRVDGAGPQPGTQTLVTDVSLRNRG